MEDAGHSGFTLVELLVTLAVVALLATTAVPAMARLLDQARLRAATQTLAEDFRQARNHALSHQRSVYFSFSLQPDDWCYGWSDTHACDCRSSTPAAMCRSGSQGRLHIQTAMDFPAVRLLARGPATRGIVRFSPVRGTATGASFALHSRYAESRVIVSPLGRVRTCSPGARGPAAC